MKNLFQIAVLVLAHSSVLAPLANANVTLFEGSCEGKMANGEVLSLKIHSDFDGCKRKSTAVIAVDSETVGDEETLMIGARTFTNNYDVYTIKEGRFQILKLTFPNTTGARNAVAEVQFEQQSQKDIVSMKCQMRSYEYEACGGRH